jgi:hypothetical protein
MAITKIHPQEMGNYNSFGQELGQSLGAGFQQGLQGLAHAKVGELLQRREAQERQQQAEAKQDRQRQLEALGATPEVAAAWDLIPDDKKLEALSFRPGNNNQMAEQPQALGDLLGAQRMPQNAIMQSLNKLQPLLGRAGGQVPGNAGQEQEPQTFADYIRQRGMNEKPEIRARREEGALNRENTNQLAIDKLNQPYIDTVYTNAEKAEAQNKILDEMDEISENGNLPGNWKEYGRRLLGISEGAGSSDAQLYRGLESRLVDGARGVYGNRIPVDEMKMFARRVPSLLNSPEGRRKVSAVFRKLNNDEIMKRDILDEELGSNEGKSTRLLRSTVTKKYNDRLNKEAKSIRAEMKEAVKSAPKVSSMTAVGRKEGFSYNYSSLPSANTLPEGTIGHDFKTGKQVIVKKGHWVPYKG